MKKKIIGLLLGVCMVATMFVGCGGESGGESDGANTKQNLRLKMIVHTMEESGYVYYEYYEDTESNNLILEEDYVGELLNSARELKYDEYGTVISTTQRLYCDGTLDETIENIWENEYDENNRLVKHTLYTDGSASTVEEYDEYGNLKHHTIGGQVTEYKSSYDEQGQMIKQEEYVNGDLLSTTTMQYDSNGDLVKKESVSSLGIQKVYEYEYDEYHNTILRKDTSYNPVRDIKSVHEYTYEYEYEYGKDGMLLKEKCYKDGELSSTTEYTYY